MTTMTKTPPLVRRPRRFSATILIATAALLLSLAYMLLSFTSPCLVGAHCYRGFHSRHSFDAHRGHYPAWMGGLPDDINITSLSIPGTHDTMTHRIGSETLQCQNHNLSAQLAAGLRYVDIRARLRDDELRIYHANGDTGYGFEDVLLTVFAFLDENPSEAVLMRLKDEGPPIGSNSRNFEEAFNYHRLASARTAPGAARHLALYDGTATPIPTLGSLRSRILLLQDFAARDGPYGLRWEGPQMALEDYWIIPDVYHLADKWSAVRDALERAATADHDNRLLYLAHLSAAVGVLPIEAAAGPMNRTIEGLNDMTGQWLRDFEGIEEATRTGVVIMDFPGKRLIEAVLRWNWKLAPKTHS